MGLGGEKRMSNGGQLSPHGSASFALIARIAVLGLCCWILAVPASRAQDTGGFPGFLQNLFGIKAPPQPAPRPNAPLRVRGVRAHKPRKKEQDFVSTLATRAPVHPTFFVAVLGDSLAILASQGLTDVFADKPEISISDAARDLSGLTRDDYYDWPKAARDLAARKQKIDVAVVMIGINDLQPLNDGADLLDPLGDRWRAVYGQRVENLIAPFRDAHIPVFWVGLPPMSDERFNAQVIALNEIFREHVEKAGGKFIDIWDALADQSGQYAAFGPDVDGQNTKLRSGPNGISFTKAGSRKLAQFLETDIRHVFDKTKPQGDIAALPPDVKQEADDINAEIRREMGADKLRAGGPASAPKLAAGAIMSLTTRPSSAHGELLDTVGAASADLGDEAHALRLGQTAEPHVGRADDFIWPHPP